MSYKIGTTTLSSTGVKTINLGTPSTHTSAIVVVQNKYATNEGTLKHVSLGETNGTTTVCTSYIKNGSNPSFSEELTSGTIIRVYEEVGGVNTIVFEGSFDSFYTNGVKINVTVANANYPVYIKAKY